MQDRSEETVASELEAGYATWHRVYELSGMGLTLVLTGWLAARLHHAGSVPWWALSVAALLGLLFADFISGFVHWLFDTWGSVDTPFFGSLAIRTFRHHHVDPKAMTQHDFVETNGHNITLASICAGFGLLSLDPAHPTLLGATLAWSGAIAIVFVSLTSQIHKWAHQDDPGAFIRGLQRLGLVLRPEHHAKHHAAPYDHHYCITIGWMNPVLRALGFFRGLEWLVTRLTGVLPRESELASSGSVQAQTNRAEPG